MAVTRLDDAVASSAATTTFTVSDGVDRALIVGVAWEGQATDMTLTYGGVAMTEITAAQYGSHGAYIFMLLDADIESAVGTTLTPTWTGSTPSSSRVKWACISYEGVLQTGGATTAPANANAGGDTTNPQTTVDLTEVIDGLIVAQTQSITSTTVTWSAAMTEQTDQSGGMNGSFADRLSTTAANVDIEATFGTAANNAISTARIAHEPGVVPDLSGKTTGDLLHNDAEWERLYDGGSAVQSAEFEFIAGDAFEFTQYGYDGGEQFGLFGVVGTWNDDQSAEMVLPNDNAGRGVGVRLDSNGDGYYMQYGGGVSRLYRLDAGSETELGQLLPDTSAADTHVRIVAAGTTITTYVDGVESLSVTDATHSSGAPGVWCRQSPGGQCESFRAAGAASGTDHVIEATETLGITETAETDNRPRVARLGAASDSAFGDSTLDHTVPAGTDRMLAVWVFTGANGGSGPTSVEFGGQTMVAGPIAEDTDNHRTGSLWYLLDAGIAAATDTTIEPQWGSAPVGQYIVAAAYEFVNQAGGATTLIDSAADSELAGFSNPMTTVDVVEADGGLVLGLAGHYNPASTSASWNAAMNELSELEGVSRSYSAADRLSTTDANVDVECTWSSTPTSHTWAASAAFAPTASGGGTDHDESDTDTIGITDSGETVVGRDADDTDTIGILEAGEVSAGRNADSADTIGITETVELAAAYVREGVELVGSSELVDASTADSESDIDAVGIGESAEVVAVVFRDGADAIGILETVETSLTAASEYVESVGISETADVELQIVIVGTDVVGISDAGDTAQDTVLEGIELVGSTELAEANESGAGTETGVDSSGITESVDVVRVTLRDDTETVGISESAEVELGVAGVEQVGSAESGEATAGADNGGTDTIGSVESVELVIARGSVSTETIGITESVEVVKTIVREGVELVGVTDSMVQDFSGLVVIGRRDAVNGLEFDRITAVRFDTATLKAMGHGHIEATTAEPAVVSLTTDRDPTGSVVEFSVSVASDDAPGATWVAGTWAGTWNSKTGLVEATSPDIGDGAALDVAADTDYWLWVRYLSTRVKRAGFVPVR